MILWLIIYIMYNNCINNQYSNLMIAFIKMLFNVDSRLKAIKYLSFEMCVIYKNA